MPWFFAFLGLQVVLIVAKVFLEELFFDAREAYYGECVATAGTSIGCYFTLLAHDISPVICWLSATGLSICAFLLSWGIPRLLELTIGWGEESEGVGPHFPLFMGWSLFLFFLATGSEISQQHSTLFIIALVVEALLTALVIFIDDYFEEPITTVVVDCFFHAIIAIGIIAYATNKPVDSSAWLSALLVLFASNVATAGFFYFSHIWWEFSEMSLAFWKRRGYIFAGQLIIALVLYLYPAVLGLVQWIVEAIG